MKKSLILLLLIPLLLVGADGGCGEQSQTSNNATEPADCSAKTGYHAVTLKVWSKGDYRVHWTADGPEGSHDGEDVRMYGGAWSHCIAYKPGVRVNIVLTVTGVGDNTNISLKIEDRTASAERATAGRRTATLKWITER